MVLALEPEKLAIRSKHRFGFEGPRRWSQSEDFTVDDFLESMSRRSSLSDQIDPETIGELDNDPEMFSQPPSLGSLRVRRSFGTGKLVFLSVLAMGVTLWVSGYLASLPGISTVERVVAGLGVWPALSNPIVMAFVAFVFFIPAFALWRRRRPDPTLVY